MSKNINYYSGLSLSKEELQFKDYADKYLSLYVDLIKSGVKDVVFIKNATDFEMTKGIGSPPVLNIKEGYCLFNGINDILTDFEYKQTLNVDDFPDQKFFVKSPEKNVSIDIGLDSQVKYIYIQNYLVPAAFSCTVASDGTITLLDTGSIRKSEVPSILRDINSNAPTRVRFLATDYSSNGINNNSIYEVNTVRANTITITGSVLAETGTVLCVPIGSFDLGSELNLLNRALFSYNETRILVNNSSTLDNQTGIVKLGYITYNELGDNYDITDLRNSNKYIISIDTEIDLSDYVTKSTTQTISSSKAFTNLIQGKISLLNRASNWQSGYILLNSSTSNDIIFNCGYSQTNINGFQHVTKSWGTNPDINLVLGTSIRVRFTNVGAGSAFKSMFSGGATGTIPITEGVLYTIRAEEREDFVYFSVSPTASDKDVAEMTSRIEQNETDISTLSGDVAAIKITTPEETVIRNEIYSDSDIKIYLSYIKKGSYCLVTVTALVAASVGSIVSSIIPATYRPSFEISDILSENVNEIQILPNGNVICKTGVGNSRLFSVTYCTGITDFA